MYKIYDVYDRVHVLKSCIYIIYKKYDARSMDTTIG